MPRGIMVMGGARAAHQGLGLGGLVCDFCKTDKQTRDTTAICTMTLSCKA